MDTSNCDRVQYIIILKSPTKLVHFFLYDMPSKVMVWEELLYTSIFHIKSGRIKIVLIFFVSAEGKIHIGVDKVIKEGIDSIEFCTPSVCHLTYVEHSW